MREVRFENIAKDANHLCPKMLKEELIEFNKIKGYFPEVIIIHLSPDHEKDIKKEIKDVSDELKIKIDISSEGKTITL